MTLLYSRLCCIIHRLHISVRLSINMSGFVCVSLMFSVDAKEITGGFYNFISRYSLKSVNCSSAHISLSISSSVRCCECSASLSHWYYEKDGQLFCKKDYWAKFGELCHGCNDPITTGLIMVRGSIHWLLPLITSLVLCLPINLRLLLGAVILNACTTLTHLSPYISSLTVWWVPASIRARRICARRVSDPYAVGWCVRLSYRPPGKVRAVQEGSCAD